MAELKTKKNKASVKEFIQSIPDAGRRKDCFTILRLMESITGSKASMWGTSIVGFGNYHYVSGSGREGDWFLLGFSPRKQALTIYTMGGLQGVGGLLEKLGKIKTGGGCLYIKSLEDIDLNILRRLLTRTVTTLKNIRRT